MKAAQFSAEVCTEHFIPVKMEEVLAPLREAVREQVSPGYTPAKTKATRQMLSS